MTGLLAILTPGCPRDPCAGELLVAARLELAAIQAAAPPLGDDRDVGLELLADWEALPSLRTDRYEQFSSRQRVPGSLPLEPGGKDFNNFIMRSGPPQVLLLEQWDEEQPQARWLGGYVLAAVDDGPGYVSRMFFTCFDAADLMDVARLGRFGNEVLRIYVDDLTTPAFVIPLVDLGVRSPFAQPWAGARSAAITSYMPIGFRHRLRVVLDGLCPLKGYFYHVDVKRTADTTRRFSPRLAEDPTYTAAERRLQDFGENPNEGETLLVDDQVVTVANNATATVFEDDTGGTIELLRFAFDPVTPGQLRALHLQVFYDESAEPAVNVPLDAFFGCREQIAPFQTLPMRVQREGPRLDAACYLPLPYASGVRVVLRNLSESEVSLRASVSVDRMLPPAPWGYLHARYYSVAGAQPAGSAFETIHVQGRGRYVGTFLFAAGRPDERPSEIAAALNILEGNELGIIDGDPCLRGTGTEDYYNGAFYFREGPFNHPFAAANFVRGGRTDDLGIVSCCRWHVLSDAIDFQRSFVLRFEYGADNPALVVRYATVAYYYLDRPEPGVVSGGNRVVR